MIQELENDLLTESLVVGNGTRLFLHRSHRTTGHPAGIHIRIWLRFTSHLEGKSVAGHTPVDPDTNGGHLPPVGPCAHAIFLPAGINTESEKGLDQNPLDPPNEGSNSDVMRPEGNDGVPDNLTGPVIGDIPSPVGPVNRDSMRIEQIRFIPELPDRENRRVSQENQAWRIRIIAYLVRDRCLKGQPGPVINLSTLKDRQLSYDIVMLRKSVGLIVV